MKIKTINDRLLVHSAILYCLEQDSSYMASVGQEWVLKFIIQMHPTEQAFLIRDLIKYIFQGRVPDSEVDGWMQTAEKAVAAVDHEAIEKASKFLSYDEALLGALSEMVRAAGHRTGIRG